MADAVIFTNTQRTSNISNQFFRNSEEVESHRFWLNATNIDGAFSQMAVGYVNNATQGLDSYDGKYINDGAIELYSLIADEKLVIQGRALPFDSNDSVPLGFKASIAGTYFIALDHFDGLFSGNQNIFIKDNLTQTVQDLKLGSYSFTSESGTYNSRFEIVYVSLLATSIPSFSDNQIVVLKKDDRLIIQSNNLPIASFKVFDIRGRLLAQEKSVAALETSMHAGWPNGVLIVHVKMVGGNSVVKKVLR